jgi:tripartite-type tricarboxylate transporter receptor subunit TctC
MRKVVTNILMVAVVVMGLFVAPITAEAIDFPNKPVTLVVPYGTGGASDVLARALGSKLSTKWDQTVIIANRPGASTTIGAGVVARARPDGYTLLLGVPPLVTSLYIYDQPPYTKDSFEPISYVATYPFVLAVGKDSKFNSLAALIEHARTNPGMTYASVGAGSTPHLVGELFARSANLKLNHIPYTSGGQATLDLRAGRIGFYAGHPLEVLPQLKDGGVRALTVLSRERLAVLPGVPSAAELGYPQLEASGWTAILAPKGTPSEIVEKISSDVRDVIKDPTFANVFESQGAIFIGSGRAELSALLAAEHAKYGPLIKEIGIKLAE